MSILRITEIELRGPHSLWVMFNNGHQSEIDLLPLLDGPIFASLLTPSNFAQVQLDPECGTITWPNGADLAPEALYDLSPPQAASASKAKLLMGTKS
ncbi:MAG: DUF2442 domain-containing protein [Gemmatales bacterium]